VSEPLSTIIARYRQNLQKVTAGSCEQVSHMGIDETPVLSGSLVLSWTASIGSSASASVSLPIPDQAIAPYGLWINPREGEYKDTAKSNATAVARRLIPGQNYYFTNGKSYAPEIEYEAKSYHKAPKGMRDITAAQWTAIVDNQVSRVRRGG